MGAGMVARIVSAARKGLGSPSARTSSLVRRAGRARAGGLAPLAAAAACTLSLGACGGGAKLDAGEPARSYPVEVLKASFPAAQSIARPASFELTVHDPGSRAVPDLAVTIDSFSYASSYPGLADRQRPVWVVERGAGAVASPPVETQEVSVPGSGQTAYVNTWAFGRLAAGATRKLVWQVVPVKAGSWTVHYAVSAGLAGRSRALAAMRNGAAAGAAVSGKLQVRVAPAPKLTHVNPSTGRVEAGQFPATP